MKKATSILAVILVALIVGAQQQQQPEKKFKFELTGSQLNVVLYCLDKSTAEHNVVTTAQQILLTQYQAQAQPDTTKKE